MPRANRSTPLPMHGTASASPSPSDANRAPGTAARHASPGLGSPLLASHRRAGRAEAGPTTGRRRQRVAAEAATPPGVVTLTRSHATGLGGRRRRNRGRSSVGSTSSICETLFLKNCTTKGNNYLIGLEGGELREKGTRMAIKFDLNNINTSVKLH